MRLKLRSLHSDALSAALLLGGLWLLAAFAAHRLQVHVESQFAAQQFKAAGNVADAVAQGLLYRATELRQLAKRIPPGWSSQGMVDERLLVRHGRPFGERVLLLSWQGGTLASTLAWDSDVILIENDLLAAARTRPEVAIGLVAGTLPETVRRVVLAVSIADGDRPNAGILLASITPDDPLVFGALGHAATGGLNAAVISPSRRSLIAATQGTHGTQGTQAGRQIGGMPMPRDDTANLVEVDRHGELLSSRRIAGSDWYVMLSTSASELAAVTHSSSWLVYGAALLLSVAGGLLFRGKLSGKAINPASLQEDGMEGMGGDQDISQQKRERDELRKFALAVEQSPVSIVMTDLDGRIEYVNPAFTRVTGYTREEAIGQNPRILQSGETEAATYLDMWAHLTRGRQWQGILKNRRKSGELIWEEITIGPLVDAGGKTTHYIAVKDDVTRRREAELVLQDYQHNLEQMVEQRTRELQAALDSAKLAERSKDEFLANMSHEIRTPLNAIIGMAGLALRSVADPRQKNYFEKIHDSGEHLLGIINDILDLSRIVAGRMPLESEVFSLEGQICRMFNVIETRVREKGLQLKLDIATDVPTYVVGDALRLNQVLMNLLGNALKFTVSGAIRLAVRKLTVDEESWLLEFSVSDTGIGMTREEIDRLFKPFSQADASITRKYGGTGLGLAISVNLVEMMGGTIAVDSTKGQGSTFRFTLRLGVAETEAGIDDVTGSAWERIEESWQFVDVRVLVVDDQPLNRMLAEELFAIVGISTEQAEDGWQAVELVRESPIGKFDLVLMDIQMPRMDGIDATRHIRALPHGADLPIIAMTAHVMDDERKRCVAAGMNDHIGKPFKPIDLINVIAAWLPDDKKRRIQGADAHEIAHSQMPVLPGFDVVAALDRFRNNQIKYRGWLRNFVETQGAAANEIAEHLQARSVMKAEMRVHLIKGQAGMLGITAVFGAAAELEAVLKRGEDPSATLGKFAEAMRVASETIRQCLAIEQFRGPAVAREKNRTTA